MSELARRSGASLSNILAVETGKRAAGHRMISILAKYLDAPRELVEAWAEESRIRASSAVVRSGAWRKRSANHLRGIANDDGRPSWVRWAARRLLDLSMTIRDLRSRRGRTGAWSFSSGKPWIRSVANDIERVLGAMPQAVKADLKAARRRGVSRAAPVLKDRVRRWSRKHLEGELGERFPTGVKDARVRSRLRGLSWTGAVGTTGYDIYMAAKAAQARSKISPDYKPGGALGQKNGPRARANQVLAATLRRLEEGALSIDACPICGGLRLFAKWEKSARGLPGVICIYCWREASASATIKAWMRDHIEGDRPPLSLPPHRQPDPVVLAEGLAFALRKSLGRPVDENERWRDRDILKRLEASRQARARRLHAAILLIRTTSP